MSTVEFLNAYRNGGKVKRMHTLEVIKEENVAQHVFGVMSILTVLYAPARVNSALYLEALHHDLAEQATGDIPAPVKRDSVAMKNYLDHQEALWAYDNLPIGNGTHTLTTEEVSMLKIADTLDLMFKCHDEILLGNNTPQMRDMLAKCHSYIEAYDIPHNFHDKIMELVDECK
jgi:5'-deoxynucleotidase YfbR-like HD superfamily hydrolase